MDREELRKLLRELNRDQKEMNDRPCTPTDEEVDEVMAKVHSHKRKPNTSVGLIFVQHVCRLTKMAQTI